MIKSNHNIEKFEGLYSAKYLRTLLPLSLPYYNRRSRFPDKVLNNLLPTLHCLRVLKLSTYDIKELPNSVGNLKLLRHLDLSRSSIERLPDTICTLYNLQTLLLHDCIFLVQLPTNLGSVISLRHLDISRTPSKIEKMPPNMGNLKDLQLLSDYVLDKHTGHSISQLKELQHLHGTLCISGLQHVVHDVDAMEANVRNKKYLNRLVLIWRGVTEDSQKERRVLDKLQPHTNLKELHIKSYGGTRFPGWLGDHSFSNLASVELVNCRFCYFLPPLGQLPFLVKLLIRACFEVVYIGPEFYGNNSTCVVKPFRSLKELTFQHMFKWQEWSNAESDREEEGGYFPSLSRLTLEECPKLTRILAFQNLLKLEKLELLNLDSFSGSLLQEATCPKFLSLSNLKIRGCPHLVCLTDGGVDTPNLQKLSISKCASLRSLPGKMHTLQPSLQSLDIDDCLELESFPEGGFPSKLRSLRLHCSSKLFANRAHWGLRRLNSLKRLSISFDKCEGVESFPEEGLLPTTLSYLLISDLNLITMQGKELHHLNSLKSLSILRCPRLLHLSDTALPASLSELVIQNCPMLNNRLQGEEGEDWPKISHIPSIRIDGSETNRIQ